MTEGINNIVISHLLTTIMSDDSTRRTLESFRWAFQPNNLGQLSFALTDNESRSISNIKNELIVVSDQVVSVTMDACTTNVNGILVIKNSITNCSIKGTITGTTNVVVIFG